jgi:tetratricopeptide (TPR) repeat protein
VNHDVIIARSEAGSATAGRSGLYRSFFLASVLVCVALLCFANALHNDFTNWDDPLYVVENELIRNLSVSSLRETVSSFLVGNYHPLTVLSLAIDYAVYGLDPGGFHLTNIVIHASNVVLVFAFLQLLTGNLVASFIAALFFAIHPVHVESVAWISERKDVLYTFFYLCSMCAYLWHNRHTNHRASLYLMSLGLFVCSLLSKGQAVTLPLVLLLIDYCEGRGISRRVLAEKIPFFVLSLIFGVVAIVAQKDTGAIPDMPTFTLGERIVFTCFNMCMYLAKLIAPIQLSAFYPYPSLESWVAYLIYCLPAAVVVVIGGLYFRRIASALQANRIVAFGVMFFVVNIALLLQVLPVGASMISERYAYLCSVGFFLLAGHGYSQLWSNSRPEVRRWKGFVSLVLLVYGGWLAHTTVERNKVWRGSEPLWSDVLRQFPKVLVAYLNRGSYYQVRGELDRALADFNAGLAIDPYYYDILVNRCDVHRMLGEYERALADCSAVIERVGDRTVAYTNRGITYSMIGRHEEALADFEKAISLEPKNAKLYTNRGNLYDMSGMYDTAIDNYTYAISLRPDYYAAYYNRGKTRLRKGDFAEAVLDFDASVQSDSLGSDSYFYRSQAFRALGDVERALQDAWTARQMGRPIDAQYLRDLEMAAKP